MELGPFSRGVELVRKTGSKMRRGKEPVTLPNYVLDQERTSLTACSPNVVSSMEISLTYFTKSSPNVKQCRERQREMLNTH